MSDLREVAITSDASGQLWNACIWNPHVGSTLMTYKGGISQSSCLSFIGRDYLISADRTKPLIHVWALNRQEQLQVRMVCPGKVSALAVSPDGIYCVCGISEKIHVWHMPSGRLMAVISKNFQRITCVKFTDDASHFATAAEDGLVLVWPLNRVVSLTQDLFRGISDLAEPRYSYNDHSLPVTDMYVGKGGMRARLLTVSLDGTAKIYDLASGAMLLSLVFGTGLTSAAMSNAETHCFVGATDGKIFQYSLRSPPRGLDYHVSETEKRICFSEHTKSITSLSVSLDGVMLMSGSMDEQVIIWDIRSMQCLRKLQHKGPVTNAFFSVVPSSIFSNDLNPSLVISSFKKENSLDNEGKFTAYVMNVEQILHEQKSVEIRDDSAQENIAVSVRDKEEIRKLKRLNQRLYGFVVSNLLDNRENGAGFQKTFDTSSKQAKSSEKKKKRRGHQTNIARGFTVTELS